jgi:lipopolysaccharide/colanic/teichoic acid biosynthesis glycosyltransferase
MYQQPAIPWVRSKTQRLLKRALDVSVACVVFLFAAPVMLVVAILVKCTSRGPAFFIQKRLGLHGTIFEVMKFRTMVDRAWERGEGLNVIKGDSRITLVGGILRLSHLDELPQLWHVLTGEMSLVGPRPTVPFQYDHYEPWELVRVDMPPGMTGWAQVNGATALSWDERIKLDVWYVENWSFWLDLKILVLTAGHILARLFGTRESYAAKDGGWTRSTVPADPFTNKLYRERTSCQPQEIAWRHRATGQRE